MRAQQSARVVRQVSRHGPVRLTRSGFIPARKIGAIDQVFATNNIGKQRQRLRVVQMGVEPKTLEALLKGALSAQPGW